LGWLCIGMVFLLRGLLQCHWLRSSNILLREFSQGDGVIIYWHLWIGILPLSGVSPLDSSGTCKVLWNDKMGECGQDLPGGNILPSSTLPSLDFEPILAHTYGPKL
jgi:hypothetical protein